MVHHTFIFETRYPYKEKPAFGYRGVATEKCQLRHDCLIVYGTNFVCDKEKIIINHDHLLTFSQIKQVEYYVSILLWCFFSVYLVLSGKMAILVCCLLHTEDNTHPTELVGYGCAYIWHIIILGSN